MDAKIVTIGDEILIGQIVDTNSAFLGNILGNIGIRVKEIISISDNADAIKTTLSNAIDSVPITLVTGGLGPTKDDITKKTLAEMFNSKMRYDESVALNVKNLVSRRGIEFNDLNRLQAEVPECCTVIANVNGTAPAMMFERGENILISMPGVPYEMKEIMTSEVIPMLKARYNLKGVVHKTMITYGVPESILAIKIEAWENALPQWLHLAYLPNPNGVRLRLSAYEVDSVDDTNLEIERRFELLRGIIPQNIIGFEEDTAQGRVAQLLASRGESLSTAESCTGGEIARRFTAMPGASQYFLGAVVAYSNDVKMQLLGVPSQVLEAHGAVSEPVVKAMAEGARKATGSTYALATSGVAGPTGGTAEKPVGTVCMALATPTETITVKEELGTVREQIIGRASAYVINMLRRYIEEKG